MIHSTATMIVDAESAGVVRAPSASGPGIGVVGSGSGGNGKSARTNGGGGGGHGGVGRGSQDGCCDNVGSRARDLLDKVPPCTGNVI